MYHTFFFLHSAPSNGFTFSVWDSLTNQKENGKLSVVKKEISILFLACACEQALYLRKSKQSCESCTRKETRIISRVASLAIVGELARRL